MMILLNIFPVDLKNQSETNIFSAAYKAIFRIGKFVRK
jgi:hypothetical protein